MLPRANKSKCGVDGETQRFEVSAQEGYATIVSPSRGEGLMENENKERKGRLHIFGLEQVR